MQNRYTFPDGWPEGCPPSDAVDAEGQFFRIVKGKQCTPDDFLTQAEKGKALRGCPCLRVGLSILCDMESAKHYRDVYPYLGERIASGLLNPTRGKIKSSGHGHVTWWSFSNVVRHSLFSVVDENS